MSGFLWLTNQKWMNVLYRYVAPYQLRWAKAFTKTTLEQIDNHYRYRFEIYRRQLPILSLIIFMFIILIFIDYDDKKFIIISAIKKSNVFNIWFGNQFTRVIVICYLIFLSYGSIMIMHRFLPFCHNKLNNLILKDLIEYHNRKLTANQSRLLRFSDQKTLKHIDWTLFGLEIIFTIAPVIYGIFLCFVF